MRPNENTDVAQHRIAACAESPNPLDDQRRLRRTAVNQRGAYPQYEGPARVEGMLAAELLACARRGAIEPVIETLCACDHDAFRRHTVQLNGLALLRLVPDEDAVWTFAN